ncbi:hypothetical protein V8E55_010324 [Tylopilus felleus]
MSGSNSELDDTDDTFVSLGPTDYFEGAAKIFDHNEWNMAEFLLTSSLIMADIDRFLSLSLDPDDIYNKIKRLGLSFLTTLKLCGLADILPKTPPWKCCVIDTSPHQTKSSIRLFYRDTMESLEMLLSNPLCGNSIDFSPYCVFTNTQHFVQDQLPTGACLLGVILLLDKMNVTHQSSGKVVHLLLMLLANIHSTVRSKASLHALLPIASLPIAKFIHRDKQMKGVLSDQLYHQSLDIVVEPLKITAQIGVMLSDPLGNSRYCFTPLAGCIVNTPEVVGADEIDFCFSILQLITSHHHFSAGITTLKQVTGKIQRDLQWYMIAIIAGAVPVDTIRAVHTLLEFRYLTQAPVINDNGCRDIAAALAEFHSHKQSIIDASARRGDKGNVLEHWQIPKLKMMQNVAFSIPLIGPLIHWTADTTEHAHIDFIKIPAAATNNHDYESQICHFLDHLEKCHAFSLALHLQEQQLGLSSHSGSSAVLVPDDDDQTEDYAGDPPNFNELLQGKYNHSRPTTNYFKIASPLDDHHSINIDDVAEHYSLPDLRAALVHYIYHKHDGHPLQIGGQRRFHANECLPFKKLQIWHKICLQQHGYHDRTTPFPLQTLNAHPPKLDWPKGRYDTAFININEEWT